MREILRIHLEDRLAMLDDGEFVPISTFIDEWGDETDDPSEARALVAGPDSVGVWRSAATGDFGAGVLH